MELWGKIQLITITPPFLCARLSGCNNSSAAALCPSPTPPATMCNSLVCNSLVNVYRKCGSFSQHVPCPATKGRGTQSRYVHTKWLRQKCLYGQAQGRCDYILCTANPKKKPRHERLRWEEECRRRRNGNIDNNARHPLTAQKREQLVAPQKN